MYSVVFAYQMCWTLLSDLFVVLLSDETDSFDVAYCIVYQDNTGKACCICTHIEVNS